jgi:hypothetical protein
MRYILRVYLHRYLREHVAFKQRSIHFQVFVCLLIISVSLFLSVELVQIFLNANGYAR